MIKLLSVTCLQSQPDAAHGEGGKGPPSTEGDSCLPLSSVERLPIPLS